MRGAALAAYEKPTPLGGSFDPASGVFESAYVASGTQLFDGSDIPPLDNVGNTGAGIRISGDPGMSVGAPALGLSGMVDMDPP